MKPNESQSDLTPAQLITNQIAGLPDWRGTLLARLRELIHAAAPNITEQWKWGTAVWSQKGNVMAAAVFKDHVKLNFFEGAALDDPHTLFNAGLDAKMTRAIDFFKGDKIQEVALKDLIRTAADHNSSGSRRK